MTLEKIDICSYDLDELTAFLESLSQPKYRAKQIFKWLQSGIEDFDQMTNIPLALRNILKEKCYLATVKIVRRLASQIDETVKYVYELYDGEYIESVLMKYEHGYTVCISTQVGCRMGCSFCASGIDGLFRNLTPSEMIAQITKAQHDNNIRISNVVMMGMGEPLDNTDQVLKALRLITDTKLLAWSPRRITLSTVGVKGNLKRFLDESECHLAISLHAPTPQLRSELMPAERIYSITDIVEVLKGYDFTGQRRLSFEYILFDGVNDTMADARKLVRLLDGLQCRINLIRFHAIPDSELDGVPMERMVVFRDYLTRHGLFTTIRASRGEDIYAACGMLSTKELKKQQNQ